MPNYKESLSDRLAEYVGTETDKDIERIHLDTAKRRRDEIRSGEVQPEGGEEVLARIRRLVEKWMQEAIMDRFQELVDFSEFLLQKVKYMAFRKRIDNSQKDIKEGRVETTTPDELFKEIGI